MSDNELQPTVTSNSHLKRLMRQSAPTRFFAGKTEKFKDNQERHFYQRMHRAYLKGQDFFFFGKQEVKTPDGMLIIVPKANEVLVYGTSKNQYQPNFNSFNNPGKVFGGMGMNKSELKDLIWDREELKFEKRYNDFYANAIANGINKPYVKTKRPRLKRD